MLLLRFDDDRHAWRRIFVAALATTLVFRLWFAAWLPFTGDEAYFYFWGKTPDWGFYDHPPMVGWWHALILPWSDAPWVLRLPALVAPPLFALITQRALVPHGPATAWGAATLLLLVPLNAWNVAITTDVPLMIFAFGAMLMYLRALRTGRGVDYLLAGLLLGGALMSKYFAGLFALALGGHRLFTRGPGRWSGFALLVTGTLPAAAIQIAWNAQNCWPNVMFNLVNRLGNAGWSWATPALYALTLVYVLGPPVVWWLLRPAPCQGSATPRAVATGPVVADAAGRQAAIVALAWMTALPFGAFALLSTVKLVGLHWVASFVAPAVWLFALQARKRGAAIVARRMRIATITLGAFALVHYLVIGVLASLPTERFANWRSYQGLVMTMHGDELIAALEPWRAGRVWASDGYSPAVTLGFNDRAARDNREDRVVVFGPGTSHARHDDILTDFSRLAGRDFLVIVRVPPQAAAYEPYFDRVDYRKVSVRGATFHLVAGNGFRDEAYRDAVLEVVRDRYYAVPAWLPAGPCYFCDRYFPDRSCHR